MGNFTRGGSAEPMIKKYKIKTLYYSSYFTWDRIAKRKAEFPPDEAAALSKAFKRSIFSVYPNMALDRFRRLTLWSCMPGVAPPTLHWRGSTVSAKR